MIRILIADDHAIVRRGLRQILDGEPDLQVAGEASDAHEALELARKVPWDVAVLDISMPGRNGLEVLKQLKHEYPKQPVLMLSMHPEDQYAVRALRVGAAGYLTKESMPEELVGAIRRVTNGGRHVSPSLAERLALEIGVNGEQPRHRILTDREYHVLCLIAAGKSVTDIAEELALSPKTISTYRSRILDKMNMKNNAELTYYCIHNNLVS